MSESFFIKLLKSGQLRIENGNFMFLNEFFVLIPVKSFLKLREMILKEMGTKGNDILKKMGRYQVSHAVKRYSKTIGFEKLDIVKMTDFGVNVMNLMGQGNYKFLSFDEKNFKIIVVSKNIPTAKEYLLIYGKSREPIDSFICGIWEEAFARVLNKEMICVETKCIAKGDRICQFEIYPAKKPK